MFKVLVLSTCLLATVVYSCKNGYAGDECGARDKTIVDTKTCTKSCVKTYPKRCFAKCPTYKGDVCDDDQKSVINTCNCSRICVDVLSEGEKCDQSKTTVCENELACVDGVCKDIEM